MFPFHWLSTLQKQYRSRSRQSARGRQHRNRHACTPCIARATPRHAVELLEDRMLLTAFTVVNTNDSGEGSLRAAIEAANTNAGADTISFDASLSGRTIVLGDELQITDDLTITGLGGLLTIDGNGDSRIFNIHEGDAETTIEVSISGLNLIRGYAEKGGAILSHGNLTLSDTQLYFNEASSKGGGLYHSDGILSVTNCNFFSNDALEYGGAISALNCSIIINDSSFSYNSAEHGGAFFETALQIPMPEILIQNSTFIENTSLKSGGAIYSGNSIIDINDSLISNNSSGSNGGGLCNSLGHMTITNSTVSDNIALKSGGGIYTNHGVISAVNSTIFQNSATESGGGIYSSGGNIKLSNSTLSGNSANLDGGGVYLSGSRIYTVPRIVPICGTNVITPEEMSLIIPSTSTPINPILLTTSAVDLVDVNISYPTLSTKTIETFKPKFNLENCTIVNNSALGSGGGIFISGNSYDDMVNNIIAGNSAETYRQVSSSITTEFNIIQDSIEGLLDPVLRDNGGPTKTHALLPGSAAINAGDNQAATDAGLTTDQRGGDHQRIYAGTVDIGAVEYHTLNLVVDILSDEDDGDYSSGHLSLREAIKLANQTFDTDQITFSNSLAGGTILLESDLLISTGMHIVGLGADQLTISGNGNSRIFNVDDGDKNTNITVEISGLTFTKGFAEQGAAILNYETLSLSDSTVSENTATSLGGGIYHAGAVLTITDTLFAENTAAYGGGIYNATQDLIISGSTFFRNSASEQGGGIYTLQGVSRYAAHTLQAELYYPMLFQPYIRSLDYQFNLVTMTGTSFSENSANQGGALFSSYISPPNYYIDWCTNIPINSSVLNGAYQSVNTDRSRSEFTISDCTFTANTAVNGGAIYNNQGQITITDSLITANTALNGAGIYHRSGVFTISNSSISGNVAQQAGGGILVHSGLTVENSSITNNKAGYGAGIYSDGNLRIFGSTLAHNTALYNGGGIYNYISSLVLSNSTISDNHAGIEGGGVSYAPYSGFFVPVPSIAMEPVADPGLILTEPASDTTLSQDPETTDNLLTPDLSLSTVDSTALAILSVQNDDYAFRPSSIYIISDLIISLTDSITNCTITGNSAGQSGGGISFSAADTFLKASLNNNIIAGNQATTYAQINGDYSGGFNIIQDSIDGLLDPVLRDNGGPTKTHALLPGSAAINAGDNQAATAAGLTTDQRGEGSQRIKEGTVDIGAFEVQGPFTEVDFRFSTSKTRRLDNGEWERLPGSRIWLDETGNYWLEIWLNTPASTNPGIQSASFNLNYNTTAATALSIEYGAAFTELQSGTINQDTGTIENLSAETARADVGDDQYTLFARIQFHANSVDSIDWEHDHHPRTSLINPEIILDQLDIRLTDGTVSGAIMNPSPDHPVWINPEPADNIPALNDQIPGILPFNFNVQPDYSFAAANFLSNNEFAYHSGLTLIDLPGGSPIENQENKETDILNELDSLVVNRDETEEDLPKLTTSADLDFSTEESDQFFADFATESL